VDGGGHGPAAQPQGRAPRPERPRGPAGNKGPGRRGLRGPTGPDPNGKKRVPPVQEAARVGYSPTKESSRTRAAVKPQTVRQTQKGTAVRIARAATVLGARAMI